MIRGSRTFGLDVASSGHAGRASGTRAALDEAGA
jgi:hypothetical protein